MTNGSSETRVANATLVKAVGRPMRSRVVPVAGLAASVIAFVVCAGVVVGHVLTPDFVQIVAWLLVSVIPLATGLVSRSYYRKLGGPKQHALADRVS